MHEMNQKKIFYSGNGKKVLFQTGSVDQAKYWQM